MLKNFNKEQFDKLKTQFDRDAILFSVLLLGILVFGSMKFLIPNLIKIPGNIGELNNQQEIARQMQEKHKLLTAQKEKARKLELPVRVYESMYKDADIESAATSLVNQIIAIIKENGDNKVGSFEFEKKDLVDDQGLKSENHAILSLKIQMVSTYQDIQNILNQIYLMDYLVQIEDVSLTTIEESDNKTVMAKIVLDLYIKT